MKTGNPNHGQGQNPSPFSLSATLGDQGLLHVVLEAVQTVDWSLARPPAEQDGRFRPQMMLTLLAFCYASGLYGSRDIEWATRIDRTIRYICAHQFPDWLAIRRFRRQNRHLLKQCLTLILERTSASASKLNQVQGDSFGHPGLETTAQDKIDLAIIMDRAESEG